jgi:hypothetical protein
MITRYSSISWQDFFKKKLNAFRYSQFIYIYISFHFILRKNIYKYNCLYRIRIKIGLIKNISIDFCQKKYFYLDKIYLFWYSGKYF